MALVPSDGKSTWVGERKLRVKYYNSELASLYTIGRKKINKTRR